VSLINELLKSSKYIYTQSAFKKDPFLFLFFSYLQIWGESENTKLTYAEMAKILSVNKRKIQSAIDKLVKFNLAKRKNENDYNENNLLDKNKWYDFGTILVRYIPTLPTDSKETRYDSGTILVRSDEKHKAEEGLLISYPHKSTGNPQVINRLNLQQKNVEKENNIDTSKTLKPTYPQKTHFTTTTKEINKILYNQSSIICTYNDQKKHPRQNYLTSPLFDLENFDDDDHYNNNDFCNKKVIDVDIEKCILDDITEKIGLNGIESMEIGKKFREKNLSRNEINFLLNVIKKKLKSNAKISNLKAYTLKAIENHSRKKEINRSENRDSYRH